MVPLVLFTMALAVSGALLLRVGSTMATVRSVSTPAATVSGEALGGDASINIDTAMAQEVAPGSGEGGSLWDQFRDGASGVADVGGAAAVAVGLRDAPAETINLLVMGVDARPGEPIDVSVRPDSLMVLHLDPETETCRLLSIPRDTRTELPGYGLTKVNNALVVGGIPYQQRVVEDLLGIEIDHYALIDFSGYQEIVDALGGVEVNVTSEFTMSDVKFTPGPRTLNGQEALAYVRYRGEPDYDFGRIRRQQEVLRSLAETANGRNISRDVNHLLAALTTHIRTDLSSEALVGLAEQYQTTCAADSIVVDGLDGSVRKLEDPLLKRLEYFVVVDEAEIQEKVSVLSGA
jgi:LCP family protein required for cell wall assembly